MVRLGGFLFKTLLLLLFAFNTIPLSIYFYRSHFTENRESVRENHQSLTENSHPLTESRPSQNPLKPWPSLPSFLSWFPNPKVPPHSCEGYFGNGFSRRIDLVRRYSGDHPGRSEPGWFRCFYSETLESSVCEGGRVRMNLDRIRMSSGGEGLEEVIGRAEEEELPSFEQGAFEIEAPGGVIGDDGHGLAVVSKDFLERFVPQGAVHYHTMQSLLSSMRFVGSGDFECSQWIEDPTLLVTRFEYANMFHTVTDWYSAYVASRVAHLPNRPHLVFLDGHCKTQLEETWEAMFSSLRYAKNFSGPVCFRHVILSPLGYETALFKGLTETIRCKGAPAHELRENPDDGKTARLSEFGEILRSALGLPVDDRQVPKPVSGHNVLFVRREDYLAHPRHDGKVQSRLSNEQEVLDALKSWATADHSKCKINIINGLFAHMPMKEQVRAIEEASVIIGAHGAGLTHIVAASSKAVILEIISSQYRRPHFALISQWRGLEYHAINLQGSYAEPNEVIDKLSSIMKNLGC
ncbi:beta-1,2-xylosyltransferase RCN11 [Magnolia sinica]|uniref:beta-1,2-xylosyltransferase RCN11 n=1 Tax=Magnolia sinica TaxID=86752 RepID=UPI00265B14A2|nr:beta-1,2-xylosyltransferase RCN11 [Magnolia sinica]